MVDYYNEDFIKARDKALRLLSYRARSKAEMEKALNDKFPEDVVSKVIELIESYGYIDDRKFAEEYIESRSVNGYGGIRLKRELRQKGIDNDIIAEAVASAELDETESAISLLERKLRGDTDVDFAEKKRCYDYLARRGYSSGVIREAFKCYFVKNS